MSHDWQRNPTGNVFKELELNISTIQCRKCGCIRITDGTTFRSTYKPWEFTWNPFKVLKQEPPCPARW